MDRLTKVFIIVAAIGIPIAIYHGYDEVTNYSTPITTVCNFNNFFSCGNVFHSGYTTFPPHDGLSMWVYGVVWFPLMVILGLWFGSTRGGINGVVMIPILMVGNFFTLYLWYLELGVIHAICPVCVSMYALNYVLTGLSFIAALRQN